ncbi:MAG TPA: chemotaxis protein CheA [Terriglobales bacterium]|nr:chemotaxis protein CheA [Terriglobales bacterium]
MSPSSDDRMVELRELFFESAQELLQALNEEALKLEKSPEDVETVRVIRRIVHTLKGDAAACGYRELSELAHELEDALAMESAAAHAQLPEVAFKAADVFTALITAYHKGGKLPSLEPMRKMVRGLADPPKLERKKGAVKKTAKSTKSKVLRKPATRTASQLKVVWSEYEQVAIQGALEEGHSVYQVTVHIDPNCGMPIAGRQLVHAAVASLGEILGARPQAGSTEPAKLVEFLVATHKTKEQVAAKCQIPTVVSETKVVVVGEPIGSPKLKSQDKPDVKDASPAVPWAANPGHEEESRDDDRNQAQVASPQPVTSGVENILRVDAERIDSVLNLVGELIIGKSMLQQALNELVRHSPKEALRGKFADAMAFQSRVLNDLQRSVMKIRMVPVEQLFRRFPRIVRDVARQCGKDVELVISGQDTDLDKSILDGIAEPLTHLVRNAVGHGIESAEDRQRSGKPAQGRIRLDAYHQGNQVVIEVSDDGRGIDAQKIRAKAIERGQLTGEEAGRLTEAEILDFIFRPGFSTAEEVTEISGRGVGMDVVQSVLQRLKGSVQLETRPGQGTSFRLKLPLTLAIIKALLFRVEERLYAIPLNAVVEIARSTESEVHQVDNYEVLQLRNQVLPLVRLGSARTADVNGRSRKLFVLIITVGERKFGLIVDQLEGEEELVIKALDDHAISTDLVSGASILGDGRVVLILNLSAVVDRFSRARPNETGAITSGLLLSHADRRRMSSGVEV